MPSDCLLPCRVIVVRQGSLARSEFVLTLDDDLMPGDDRLLEELVRELRAERDPSRILGFTGCALCPDASKK